jgi:hypothetical protein
MRLTKRQLRKMINEEIANHDYKIDSASYDDMLDEEFPEDVEAFEDVWAGGANLHEPEDFVDNVKGIESLIVTENQLKKVVYSVINEMKFEPKGPLDREWLNLIANGKGEDDYSHISPELVRELGDWIVTNDEMGQPMTPKECTSCLHEIMMEEPVWQTMNLSEEELNDALWFMIDQGVASLDYSENSQEGLVMVHNLDDVMALATEIS